MSKRTVSIFYTIQGSIVDATLLEKAQIFDMMRCFQASRRYAYRRLLERQSKKETLSAMQTLFLRNYRYNEAAFQKAKADLDSQLELLWMYVHDLEAKIKRSQEKLENLRTGKARPRGTSLARAIAALERRIEKLVRRRDFYQGHLDAGTVPPKVFGGRKTFRALCRGKIPVELWRELRSNGLYSRGQANQHGLEKHFGNANMELIPLHGNLFKLNVYVPPKDVPVGKGIPRRAEDWLKGLTVWVPDHQVQELRDHLRAGRAYSVEIRREGDALKCHITLHLTREIEVNEAAGMAGCDLNPKGIAVTIVWPNGNLRASRWFPCPELEYVSKGRRDHLTGILVRDAVRWIKNFGVNQVAIGRPRFRRTSDTDRRFNRMSHNFIRKKMRETFHSRCFREAMWFMEVNEAYTSIIGRFKYAEMYGLSVHQAAALVIARRAMGFKERVPEALARAAGIEAGRPHRKAWKEAWAFLEWIRRHAQRHGAWDKTWRLDDYLRYPCRPSKKKTFASAFDT